MEIQQPRRPKQSVQKTTLQTKQENATGEAEGACARMLLDRIPMPLPPLPIPLPTSKSKSRRRSKNRKRKRKRKGKRKRKIY